MATDTSDVQGQPGSATVRETAIVLDSIRDGSDGCLNTREPVKDSHACDVNQKPADRSVETEPNDTTLISKPMLCKSKSVEKTRTSITRDLSSKTDLFYQVIESYQKYTKGHHLPPDFDIRKAHNWDEVHQAASLAQTRYEKDGTRSIFGKIGRGIQKSTPAVEPWLELIPDGDYTSVLCGGLKIAFGVAGHIHEQREQIFETFQQIPETIRLAEDRLEEWPDDETLHDAAIELYLAVLESIEAMIIWLVDKSTRKKIWQLLMNPKTEKPNHFGLDVIQKEVKRLQDRATTLQSKAIVRTDANAEKTRSVVNKIKISTQSVESTVTQELRPMMIETRNLLREIRWKTDVCARAARSDIPTNAMETPKLGPYNIIDCHVIMNGGYGVYTKWVIGDLGEEFAIPMVDLVLPLSTATPGLREENCRLDRLVEKAHEYFLKGLKQIGDAIGERHTITEYLQLVAKTPKRASDRNSYGRPLRLRKLQGENVLINWGPNCKPMSKKQDVIKSKL